MSSSSLFGAACEEPWFAGSLLAFIGDTTPPGRIKFEPYYYFTRVPGTYNKDSEFLSNRNVHHNQGELEFKIGLVKNVELEVSLLEVYTTSADRGNVYYGNNNVYLGFQLFENQRNSFIPDVRFLIGQSFPNGRFTHVNSSLTETSVSSSGSYATVAIFVMRKIFFTNPAHPYNWTFNFSCILPRPLDLKGATRFGDDPNIRGRFRPGVQYEIDLAFEYKFTKHWGFDIDIFYKYQNSGSFISKIPEAPVASTSSSSTLSLAPAIEYDVSSDLSIVAGIWFSIYGRNSNAFSSGVVTLTYEF